MKIKSLEFEPALFKPASFPCNERVVLVCGQNADEFLDLIRITVGDVRSRNITDSGCTVYSEVEFSDKSYDVCCMLNADGLGQHRIGVGFEPGSSSVAAASNEEYVSRISDQNTNGDNAFYAYRCNYDPSGPLSESDRALAELDRFIDCARLAAEVGDERPLFVYGVFERIDKSASRLNVVRTIASAGRQAFVSVSSPDEANALLNNTPNDCFAISI